MLTRLCLRVNDNIESHEFPEGLVVKAEHLGVVGTVVKCWICFGDVVVVAIAVMEDDCSNAGNTSADVKGIFEGGVPVLALVDAS